MKTKEAKKVLRKGAYYYLHQRGVIGTHFEEWEAVDHLLNRLEKKEQSLAAVRAGLRDLLKKWKDDARRGRGATIGVADRINKLLKECR